MLLGKIISPKATADHAIMYRALGDWHAANGRWQKAVNRFAVLIQINQMTSDDTTLDDLRYAPLLVELNKVAEYERFRESLIARYAGTDNPVIAERVVKACLLKPANADLTKALGRYIEVAENSLTHSLALSNENLDLPMAAWRAYTLSLMAYRRGNYQQAIDWGQRSRDYDLGMQSRVVSVQVIRAMALARLGQVDQARAELADPRVIIEDTFKRGVTNLPRWEGFWFDWVVARITLREAETAAK